MDKLTVIVERKARRNKLPCGIEALVSNLGKNFRKLWKTTLASNLHAKDKAEILRMLILAFIVFTQTALFVWVLTLLL